MAEPCFIKVTNRDIYNKLIEIERNLGKIKGVTRWHSWAISFIVIILVAVISRMI